MDRQIKRFADIPTEEYRQEKQDAKKRTLLNRAEAKKERATRTFELQQTIARRENELKEAKAKVLADSNLNSAQKGAELKQITREKAALRKYCHSQKKDIRIQYRFQSRNRSFLSALDAFLSKPPMWVVNLIFVAIFLGVFIYFAVEAGLFTVNHGSATNIKLFFKGLFVPDYGLFFGTGRYSFEQSVFYLCIQTFAIAFLGTLFSALLSIPFGFLASKKLFGRWSYISMVLLIVVRTIPEILFCFVMVRITGFGPITGVVVLSIQSIGMIGKMYSDNLDSIDMSYLEALDAAGSSKLSKIRLGVLPQVFPNFISTVLYRFDLNLRTASILGLVGAGDLGRLILTYSQNANWPQLGAIIWGLLAMVLLVDLISTQIRKKLV